MFANLAQKSRTNLHTTRTPQARCGLAAYDDGEEPPPPLKMFAAMLSC